MFADILNPQGYLTLAVGMWKSLGLTTAMLILAGVALDRVVMSDVHLGPVWLSAVLSTGGHVLADCRHDLSGAADRLAGGGLLSRRHRLDRSSGPSTPAGRRDVHCRSGRRSRRVRSAFFSVAVNIAVLALTIFTGVGLAAFFVLNGYLLGREISNWPRCATCPRRRLGPVRTAFAGRVWGWDDCLGPCRRACPQPADPAVCDCAHDPRL